jgi:hypothetical protein
MSKLIEQLHNNTLQLLNYLGERDELSLHSFANEHLRKVLLLSAASLFEVRISQAVSNFAAVHSQNHPGILALIKKKAVDRQYHTYFDWKNQKAGPFYGLFGEVFGGTMKKSIEADAELAHGQKAFLELGSFRNELVHQNFAMFPFEKTSEEVYELYLKAEHFVVYVEACLSDSNFGS